jgi:hypothetical protein
MKHPQITECDITIPTRDLRLGDVVVCPQMDKAAWCHAIVKQLKDDSAVLFRPYGAHDGFVYTGGVICYIGLEEFDLPLDHRPIRVLRRSELA